MIPYGIPQPLQDRTPWPGSISQYAPVPSPSVPAPFALGPPVPLSAPSTMPITAAAPQAEPDFESTLYSMSAMAKSVPHKALGRSPNDVAGLVQVVSLGSSCGVKMTLRRLGLDEATMPFDWIRTRSKGLIHWLQTGFTDFFRSPFHRMEVIFRDSPMTVYRCHTHSFWHDNIEDLGTRQKLWRRIQRFLSLATDSAHASPRKLLFVRTAVTSEELDDSETLYRALEQHFGNAGREVWLLIICEDQQLKAPIRHQSYERLIHYMQPIVSGPIQVDGEGAGPYEEAVGFAVRMTLGDPGATAMAAQCQRVAKASDIIARSGSSSCVGCKPCEAGLWAGRVTKKGEAHAIMFCAFEGYSEREVPWIWAY
mmetsp:Transcript_42570/g.67953  ORF Transcript_42570/g.67953 Transcript_42570/m.67953 type:complete len:367 (-) Transcript_42570:132-1232(-)